MELISREALIEELKKSRKYHAQNGRELELLCRCENIVNEQPTVESVPVVHGEWIAQDGDWKSSNTGEPLTVHQCSNCRNYFIHAPYNFCPNCGADMRKKG